MRVLENLYSLIQGFLIFFNEKTDFNSGLTVQHWHCYYVQFLLRLHRSLDHSSLTMKWLSLPAIQTPVHWFLLVAGLQNFVQLVPENYSNCDLWHSTAHRLLAMVTVHTCVVVLWTNDDASQTRCHRPSRKNRNHPRSERSIYEAIDLFEWRSNDGSSRDGFKSHTEKLAHFY